ncbi:hypothetical protein [Bacillus taeanensis]|uniref:Uncharacterized protein n=1 Tax=Bacillus taeanensis TaxID=273032 RepID=A0A366XSZ2_9BACI|nr:hypothetical protein [Bacillus taeanensis]RBW69262.1 hypothetical protein DS031_12855 [Bacillus taeanensis]
MTDQQALELLVGYGIVFFIVTFVLGLVGYLLIGFAYLSMTKQLNIPNGWLAFIPFANVYIQGEVVTEKLNNKGGLIFLLALIAAIVLGAIPILGIIISIAFAILGFMVLYWTYNKFSEKALLMIIFSILSGGILTPIFLFAIRNNPVRG